MKTIQQASKYQQALCHAHLVSNGIDYANLQGPVIGVVNSFNEVVPGHVTLRDIADRVKNGIRMQGGMPLEFNTIAVCDGMAQGHDGMKYPLPSREIIADSIEVMVRAHGIFDGLVFITGCDKITPAMLMAAARLDIPSIFVSGGPGTPRERGSQRKAHRQRYLAGEINEQQLAESQLGFYTTPGVCAFFGTATTMLVAAEALGLTLSGTALIPAYTGERFIAAERTGRRIVELVAADRRPSHVVNEASLSNTVAVLAALGGSLNALLHLPAVARALGLPLDWQEFDRVSRRVPLLAGLLPNGPNDVVDLHYAGGVPAVMKELGEHINLEVVTVDTQPLRNLVGAAANRNPDVLRSLADPLRLEGGTAVLQGNLAPEGAIVKQSAVAEDQLVLTAAARVFEREEDCTEAILAAEITEDTILVIRNEGPMGGPGMREMHRITEMIGRFDRVAVVTDGRFSGMSGGIAVGYVSPEACLGGPIGLVEDGDTITIDIPQRILKLHVDAEELAARRANVVPKPQPASGYLDRYRRSVGKASEGAILT